VATLFDGMMQEVGLDDERLALLLERGFQSKEKKIFAQLLLCDDFLKFKEIMVKRNKQLEKEALSALNGEKKKESKIDIDRNIVRESIKLEEERKRKRDEEDEEMIWKVIELSKREAEERKQFEEMETQATKLEQEKLREGAKKKSTEAQPPAKSKAASPPKTQQLTNATELPPVKAPNKK
jgi:hypothetical protein